MNLLFSFIDSMLRVVVLSSRMAPLCWYATLHYNTGHHLFTSSIPNQNCDCFGWDSHSLRSVHRSLACEIQPHKYVRIRSNWNVNDVCVRVCVQFLFVFRIVGDKPTYAYVPTHVRMSSWMIGIIAASIINAYPKDSIRVKTVSRAFYSSTLHSASINFLYLVFVSDIQWRCVSLFISRHVNHIVELLSARIGNDGFDATVSWAIWCIQSYCLVVCTELHNFLMRSSFHRFDQSIFVASILATGQSSIVCHVLCPFCNHLGGVGQRKETITF